MSLLMSRGTPGVLVWAHVEDLGLSAGVTSRESPSVDHTPPHVDTRCTPAISTARTGSVTCSAMAIWMYVAEN